MTCLLLFVAMERALHQLSVEESCTLYHDPVGLAQGGQALFALRACPVFRLTQQSDPVLVQRARVFQAHAAFMEGLQRLFKMALRLLLLVLLPLYGKNAAQDALRARNEPDQFKAACLLQCPRCALPRALSVTEQQLDLCQRQFSFGARLRFNSFQSQRAPQRSFCSLQHTLSCLPGRGIPFAMFLKLSRLHKAQTGGRDQREPDAGSNPDSATDRQPFEYVFSRLFQPPLIQQNAR